MNVGRPAQVGVAIVTLALAVGPTALAQSEEPLDPMGASAFTATWTPTGGEGGEQTTGPVYSEAFGAVGRGDVGADDPRISGTFIQIGNVRYAPSADDGGDVGIVNGAARIENDEGAWDGTYTAYGTPTSSEEFYVLEGEGAFKGLTAVFRWRTEDGEFEGVIVPAELPALPDPNTVAQAEAWKPTLSGRWESAPGGPEVAYACYGEGTPVVVVEAGSDSSGIGSYQRPFMEPLAARTTVCTYDRLGTGQSDAPIEDVRTLDDISAVLEGLLDSLPFEPPYVLVGQSAGGNFVIGYADRHPDQVAGLVSIEAYHDDVEAFAAELAEAGISPADNPEHVDNVEAGRQLDAMAMPVGDFPVLVITATDGGPDAVENQAYWLGISPYSEQAVLEGGHDLQWDDPAGVTALILEMLDSL